MKLPAPKASYFHESRRRPPSGFVDVNDRLEAFVGKIPISARYHQTPRHLCDDYVLSSNVLGSGYNGEVVLATGKLNSQHLFAVKSFQLDNVENSKLIQIRSEVAHFLSLDHPHIVRLVDVYETRRSLHLVMECLEGGELFDRLVARSQLSEDEARGAVHQMLLALSYMHHRGVVHRDVKLENFVYEKQGGDRLKLIDFGFSQRWSPASCGNMSACLGTLSYMAPEVLAGSYTSQCDLWSLGVASFMLLTGEMPFHGTDMDQRNAICEGRFRMKPELWSTMSPEAKDFIPSMLQVDPCLRLTARQALDHPWFSRHHFGHLNGMPEVVQSLKQFADAPAFARECMRVLSWSLSTDDRAKVCDFFLSMDTKRKGTITFEELQSAMAESLQGLDQTEVSKVFQVLDYNRDKEIHFSDFLAAMVGNEIDLTELLITSAFRRFDSEGSGFLNAGDLSDMLGNLDSEALHSFIQEVCRSNDGCICPKDFAAYLRSGTCAPVRTPNMKSPQCCDLVGVLECLKSYWRRLSDETADISQIAAACTKSTHKQATPFAQAIASISNALLLLYLD